MAQLKDTTINGSLDITGDISLDGTLILNGNNTSKLYGTTVEGDTREVFCPVSSAGNTTINYGSYDAESGGTNIYGNVVKIMSNTTIETEVPIEQHAGSFNCSTATTLSTSYKRIPMKNFVMAGDTSLFTCVSSPYVGVMCNRTGTVLISAVAHATDYTNGDSLGACIYKNASAVGGSAYVTTPTNRTYGTVHITPTIMSVSAGDVFSLCVYNLHGARGTLAASARNRMVIQYLN